jgi:hypothetical protein
MVAVVLVGCAKSEPAPIVPSTAPPAPQPTAPAPVKAAPIDPTSITGYVRGMGVPEKPQGEGAVSALEVTPRDEYLSDVRLVVGSGFAFKLIVPRALPLPLAVGDRVKFQASGSGGGPNWRGNMLVFAADGTLLLAVDRRPQDWTVESGQRKKSENQGDYIAHSHETVFEHAGAKLVVAPGKWARFDAGAESFYVWGASVERTRTGGGLPPPDYVGGWLDFAIVRAR